MKRILISVEGLGVLSAFSDATLYTNSDGGEVKVFKRQHGLFI